LAVHIVCDLEKKNDLVKFEGKIICISNLENSRVIEVKPEIDERKCVVATGRSKPKPPIKICDCTSETNRHKSLLERAGRIKNQSVKECSLVIGVFCISLAVIITVSYMHTYSNSNVHDEYTLVRIK